jgi:hypothetical protein
MIKKHIFMNFTVIFSIYLYYSTLLKKLSVILTNCVNNKKSHIKARKFHTLDQVKNNWEYEIKIMFPIISPPLPSLIPDRLFQ